MDDAGQVGLDDRSSRIVVIERFEGGAMEVGVGLEVAPGSVVVALSSGLVRRRPFQRHEVGRGTECGVHPATHIVKFVVDRDRCLRWVDDFRTRSRAKRRVVGEDGELGVTQIRPGFEASVAQGIGVLLIAVQRLDRMTAAVEGHHEVRQQTLGRVDGQVERLESFDHPVDRTDFERGRRPRVEQSHPRERFVGRVGGLDQLRHRQAVEFVTRQAKLVARRVGHQLGIDRPTLDVAPQSRHEGLELSMPTGPVIGPQAIGETRARRHFVGLESQKAEQQATLASLGRVGAVDRERAEDPDHRRRRRGTH